MRVFTSPLWAAGSDKPTPVPVEQSQDALQAGLDLGRPLSVLPESIQEKLRRGLTVAPADTVPPPPAE